MKTFRIVVPASFTMLQVGCWCPAGVTVIKPGRVFVFVAGPAHYLFDSYDSQASKSYRAPHYNTLARPGLTPPSAEEEQDLTERK